MSGSARVPAPNRSVFRGALLAAALLAPDTVVAQRPPWLPEQHLRPAVYGKLSDSTTGRPASGVGIAIRGGVGMSFSDAAGWYVALGPRGRSALVFYCPSRRRQIARPFATLPVSLAAATDTVVNGALDLRGCVEPRETTRRAEFRGHYVGGFETRDFTPCGRLPEFGEQYRGTAYEGLVGPPIWVEFAPGAYERGPPWPSSKSQSYPRRYVRWRGTLTGPGAYGHMGVAFYELRVEQILEVRPARKADCR